MTDIKVPGEKSPRFFQKEVASETPTPLAIKNMEKMPELNNSGNDGKPGKSLATINPSGNTPTPRGDGGMDVDVDW